MDHATFDFNSSFIDSHKIFLQRIAHISLKELNNQPKIKCITIDREAEASAINEGEIFQQ